VRAAVKAVVAVGSQLGQRHEYRDLFEDLSEKVTTLPNTSSYQYYF